MNFYIRIEGHDGTKSVPLENLLDKGVNKKTWICIDGTEDWNVAENFRELDSLWENEQKKKNTSKKNVEIQKTPDENNSILIPKTEEPIVLSPITLEQNQDNSENIFSIEILQEPPLNNLSNLAIKRMIVSGLIILFAFIVGSWVYKNYDKWSFISPETSNGNNVSIKNEVLQTELENKLSEGIELVKASNHFLADSIFGDVMNIINKNKDLDTSKIKKLANEYRDMGNEFCKSKNIDIAQDFFNHAAILSNTKPQICR